MGDCWYRAGEFRKASDAYAVARPLVASDPLADARLMVKLSQAAEKLGKYAEALSWTELAQASLRGLAGEDAAREAVRAGASQERMVDTCIQHLMNLAAQAH